MILLSCADIEAIRRQLEDLGFQPRQTRLLLALLRAGPANTAQLAELADVHRTSIYPLLKGLSDRGFAEPVPTYGPAVWTCSDWATALDALDADVEMQLRQHLVRTRRLRQTLSCLLPVRSAGIVRNEAHPK